MPKLIFGLILIQLAAVASAEMDASSRQGLKDTQRLLTSPRERSEAIKNDAPAKDIDAKLEALTGSDKSKEDVYGLASQVFEKIAAEAGGDPEKMQALLLQAQANPKAFYEKYFNAAERAQLSKIASEIEKGGNTTPPSK